MRRFPSPDREKNMVEAAVTIQRPVSEVFAFYQDFRNLPRFLGDVMDVAPAGPGRSRWTVRGPLGLQIHWAVEVTQERPNELIRYETSGLPGARGCWEIHFAPEDPGSTTVREVMTMPWADSAIPCWR
jgi:uncharacterized membrane protein